ncbi:MAG: glycosyltransferase family 2 protein [Nanoarchaeota archaeon]
MTELSIVIPTYNEEGNISILYSEIKGILDPLKKEYEIIFIDDGSADNTFRILKSLHEKDRKIKIIRFRKNFGQTAALDAGFKSSKGNIVIVMDSDLQNDPKDIPNLLEKINEGYDVVSGWRFKRKDPLSKRLFSRIANSLRKAITKEKIHDSGCSLKAYKKECLNGLSLYGEMHRFIPAILSWKGFKIGEVKVNHRKRKYGKTKYGIKRLVKGFLDLMVLKFWMQYSARPIHLFGGMGILSSITGLVIGIYLTIAKIFYGVPLSNRPLLLLSMLLLILGVLLLVFGVLADIMIKLYYKDNQVYSIKEKIE